jgi:hypothetical protein
MTGCERISVKKVIKEIEAIFNRSGLTVNIEIKKTNIMLGLYGGDDLDVIISILAVNPDLLNIASISFKTFFTEGHLKKNRCCIVSSLSLIWQRWHFPLDKFIFFNLCSV